MGTFTVPEAAAVGHYFALKLPSGGSIFRAKFQANSFLKNYFKAGEPRLRSIM